MINNILKFYRHIFYEIYRRSSKKRYWRDPVSLPAMAIYQFIAMFLYPLDIFIIIGRLYRLKITVHLSEFIVMIIGIPLLLLNYHYLAGEDRLEKTISEFEIETKEEKRKWRIIAEVFINLPWLFLLILLFTGI